MKNLDYTAIGKRIRDKRKGLKMTQKELGDKVNLSEASVSKYEAGKVEYATTNKLNEFAAALDADISWLLGIAKNDDIGRSFKTIAAHYEGIELSEEEQEEVNNYIQYLLSKRKNQK